MTTAPKTGETAYLGGKLYTVMWGCMGGYGAGKVALRAGDETFEVSLADYLTQATDRRPPPEPVRTYA